MINILYDCKYFTVCEKPSGLISELSEKTETSLPALLSKQLGDIPLFTVHRLDKEVGGIIVYAKSEKIAAALSAQITDSRFKKEYTATVSGKPTEDSALLCDLLFHDRAKNKTYVVKRKRQGVKEARLSYELLSYDEKTDRSLLKIKLYTGRTHQIRVQLASRGFPICGDRKYGSAETVKPMRLFASSLSFVHPVSEEELSFSITPDW